MLNNPVLLVTLSFILIENVIERLLFILECKAALSFVTEIPTYSFVGRYDLSKFKMRYITNYAPKYLQFAITT